MGYLTLTEMNSIWIIIAAYNEGSAIGSVVQSVRRLGYDNLMEYIESSALFSKIACVFCLYGVC